MNLRFNCSDSFLLYECTICGLFSNERIHYILHKCGSKREVRFCKQLCDKCPTRSYSKLWIFSHQIKHEQYKSQNTNNKLKTVSNRLSKSYERLSCDQCTFSNTSKRALKSHFIAMHTFDHKKISYKCKKCNWECKYPWNLQYHLKREHFREKKYQCNECNYQTHQNDFLKRHKIQRHTPSHLISWYNCNICSYRAKQQAILNQHMKAMHPPDGEIVLFTSSNCDFETKTYAYLKHNPSPSEKLANTYKCDQCAYQTFYKSHLKSHLLAKHTPDHLINWLKCGICIFKTKKNWHLKRHMTTMHMHDDQVNWFTCKLCNAKYKQQGSLKCHMFSYHSTELSCFDCEYKAEDFFSLRQHLKNVHLRAAKRYECDKCLYDTNQKSLLSGHLTAKHTTI